MKKFCIRAVSFAAAFAAASSMLFTSVSALSDNIDTQLIITRNPDCYAEITIDGNHFTVDGKVVDDPVREVKFSVNAVEMNNYEFTSDPDDHTFHAEFDAQLTEGWCNFWLVGESNIVKSYRIQHDDKGWGFPDNGLAEGNAEKLEHIQTAAPAASAYYLSQTADPEEIEWTLAELERIVQEVCGDEQDDYKKALLLFHWEIENIYYDHDAAETEVTLDTVAVHNVLERSRSTCAGFSNTYCALLETAGIRSVNLKGAAVAGEVSYEELLTAGENHEFTAFWYEKENRWAYVDPTWGSNGDYRSGEYTYDYVPSCEYFDVSDEAFALNHRIDRAEERNYTGALEVDVEGADEPVLTSETTTAEETEPAATTLPAPVTTQNNETAGNSNFIIYIVIGAVGVIIVAVGIILALKKK